MQICQKCCTVLNCGNHCHSHNRNSWKQHVRRILLRVSWKESETKSRRRRTAVQKLKVVIKERRLGWFYWHVSRMDDGIAALEGRENWELDWHAVKRDNYYYSRHVLVESIRALCRQRRLMSMCRRMCLWHRMNQAPRTASNYCTVLRIQSSEWEKNSCNTCLPLKLAACFTSLPISKFSPSRSERCRDRLRLSLATPVLSSHAW